VLQLEQEVSRLEKELERVRKQREDERAGRTHAQRELRRVLLERVSWDGTPQEGGRGGTTANNIVVLPWPIRSIGVVRSPFPTRMGTPRQGVLAPSTRGWIQLESKLNPAAALDGLQQFSHVWIIFVFHCNTNAEKAMMGDKGLKAKVRPPRLGGARVGLFSTRTPHRPNPIGLTIAKVEKLEHGMLHISGVDLVDGTPVLDIKPYLARYDSLPHATAPDWIDVDGSTVQEIQTGPIQHINWSGESAEAVSRLLAEDTLQFYSSGEDDHLRHALEEVLRLDPRSAFQRSLSASSQRENISCQEKEGTERSTKVGNTFMMAFDNLEVEFCYPSHNTINILTIRPRSTLTARE